MTAQQDQNSANLREKEREVAALRDLLARTKTSSDPETRLTGLIDVVESLIEQLGRHAGVIEELRSDMTHKQGIVTKIGGGDY